MDIAASQLNPGVCSFEYQLSSLEIKSLWGNLVKWGQSGKIRGSGMNAFK